MTEHQEATAEPDGTDVTFNSFDGHELLPSISPSDYPPNDDLPESPNSVVEELLNFTPTQEASFAENEVDHDSFVGVNSAHGHESVASISPSDLDHGFQADAETIEVHRTNVLMEMVKIFIDPSILSASVKYKLINERGEDALGVSREVYSAFWEAFFASCAVGEMERVPAILPDYGKSEWEAIWRILVKGFVDVSVFPLQLSQAFVCAGLFGEARVSGDLLLESLRRYLSDTDKDVIDKALVGETLESDDSDDFLDLLGRVGCHAIPSRGDMRPMIISIAHKELIQEPKYALDAFSRVAGPSLQAFLPTQFELCTLYDTKTPCTRKVLKLLKSFPGSQDETSALSFLKQFIKSMDCQMLRKFLRVVTGCEYISVEAINITFNRQRGFGRTPQIRTCGPLIELPSTYGSYREFRSEWSPILQSNYLNMDLV